MKVLFRERGIIYSTTFIFSFLAIFSQLPFLPFPYSKNNNNLHFLIFKK